jgi:hypothetical protein
MKTQSSPRYDPAYYRQQARDLREIADTAVPPDVNQRLLETAAEYESLAISAQRSHA